MSTPPAPPFFTGHTLPDDQPFDAWTEQPLLMSLEAGGLDWPSSCRNGTCRTCIGKLESGQIRYETAWPGVSTEEKAAGYLLPCVAYPCSDVTLRRLD